MVIKGEFREGKDKRKGKEQNGMENGVIGIETDEKQNENYLFSSSFYVSNRD